MIKNKTILSVIPARGGSKGVYRKNIKHLSGQPLISYTIDASRNSKYIDRTIVSTDDEEIADISMKYGADIPFIRPNNLADDHTSSMDVLLHSINYLKKQGFNYDYVCLLQCTSPFRNTKHIDEAIEKLINTDEDSIISVSKSQESPYWMKKIVDGKLEDFIEDKQNYTRRQDLPQAYSLNGAIYIAKVSLILDKKTFYTQNTLPYEMDELDSIDIDTSLDFKFAEIIMKKELEE